MWLRACRRWSALFLICANVPLTRSSLGCMLTGACVCGRQVILMAGLQGVGKTTACGKLALALQRRNKRVLMVATDVYRCALLFRDLSWGLRLHCPHYTVDMMSATVHDALGGAFCKAVWTSTMQTQHHMTGTDITSHHMASRPSWSWADACLHVLRMPARRPAAIEQLVKVGERISVPVFEMGTAAKPADIARCGLAKARAEDYDAVIVDTAGRLQVGQAPYREGGPPGFAGGLSTPETQKS